MSSFFQHNFIPNYRNNILNLVKSDNNTLEVSKCSFPLIPVDIAHPPLQINGPNFVSSLKKPFPSPEPNFRRGNYESMNAYLHNIDWDSLLSDSLDFSVTVSNFYSVINDAINSFIPKIYIHKHQYLQWYSRKLKSLIYNKKRLHKEFKVTKDPLICNEFSRLRSLCKRESKLSNLRYLQKIQSNLTSDPKSFWRYINGLKTNNCIPQNMILEDKSSTGGPEVVNLFKEFFSSVYSTDKFNIGECLGYSKNYADTTYIPGTTTY